MEKIKSIIKFIISILILIIVTTISSCSLAANTKIYTSKLIKGDNLEFTGKTWAVYKTKSEAQSIGEDKHPKTKRNLKKGEKIKILEISGNAIKIKKDEYIYYGSNASRYFKKIQEKDIKTDDKKNTKSSDSKKSNDTKKSTEIKLKTEKVNKVNYYVISDSLNDVLKKVGEQPKGHCLEYALKYADELLTKKTSYKVLGSDDEKAILKVVASEIYEGRPVFARAQTSKKVKENGKEMCKRHFVTIVRNKKESGFK